ncbi:MAG: extracellular solute-binding protein [Oscillospiraceae bacterium]|nr:extracellular solute-binding protein [Oscillospiraceae bacterium]
MKRKISLILICALLVLSVAACTSAPPEAAPEAPAPTPEAATPAPPVDDDDGDFAGRELVVGIWGGNDTEMAAMEEMRLNFEAMTGASVTFRVYTDYNMQIQADFIAGTAPDVFYVDANMFPFFDSLGVLAPLDRQAVDADAFYTNLVDTFVGTSGQLYAVSKDFSTLALYVNLDMLEEVGLTVDDLPTAWEDFVEFLPAFQAQLDEAYGAGAVAAMSYNLELARNLHLLNRGGASVIGPDGRATLDTPGVLENFQLIMDLVETGAYQRPQDLGLGWNGEAFGVGRVAIMDEGNWVYNFLRTEFSDVNFAVLNMPSFRGEVSSMMFTVGYGMFIDSENQDLALEWIRYATGVDGMAIFTGATGVLPSRQDVADKIDVAADPFLQIHLDQVQHAIPWSMGLYSSIINDEYMNFLLEAVQGNMTVEEAMRLAEEQANFQIGG